MDKMTLKIAGKKFDYLADRTAWLTTLTDTSGQASRDIQVFGKTKADFVQIF